MKRASIFVIAALIMAASMSIAGDNYHNYTPDKKLAISAGLVTGQIDAHRFGRSANVDQTATDLWDGANDVDDQKIWTAPTQARTHDLTSSSAANQDIAVIFDLVIVDN